MYCVCQQKATGELFIITRKEREMYISIFIDSEKEIESFVVKACDTMEEAIKYVKGINNVNDLIDDL